MLEDGTRHVTACLDGSHHFALRAPRQPPDVYAKGSATDEQPDDVWEWFCGGSALHADHAPLFTRFESYSGGMKSIVLVSHSQKLLWMSYLFDLW